eukprot:4094209-Prymnesium_polylepis.1
MRSFATLSCPLTRWRPTLGCVATRCRLASSMGTGPVSSFCWPGALQRVTRCSWFATAPR